MHRCDGDQAWGEGGELEEEGELEATGIRWRLVTKYCVCSWSVVASGVVIMQEGGVLR